MENAALNHFANFEDFGGKDLQAEEPAPPSDYELFIELLTKIEDPTLIQLAKLQLEARMPTVSAEKLDLAAEAAQALQVAKLLLAQAAADRAAPYNQKTSAMNGFNRALTQLQQLQAKIYNVSRARKLEEALITVLRGRDDGSEILQEFKTVYERLVGETIQVDE